MGDPEFQQLGGRNSTFREQYHFLSMFMYAGRCSLLDTLYYPPYSSFTLISLSDYQRQFQSTVNQYPNQFFCLGVLQAHRFETETFPSPHDKERCSKRIKVNSYQLSNMRATVLLAALAAAGSASAVVTKIAAEDVGYEWDVTAWNAGCIHDGCFYGPSYTQAQGLTSMG
ncbi:hypothetical protein F5Y17DRAFT_312136 [Xylariaceae sp. FL0594]|nr:hypothetical protein F5Y17DRAFT_312136 [Xylariaceae sp. FL0594]